jgi:3-oxoacyl-[acyl-carrier protein] reductase
MSVYDLTGRRALVTGGARGLGEGMARALARAGASVVIGDIREDLGKACADSLRSDGARAEFVPLDITAEESWAQAISQVIAHLGGLDILINNAGVGIFADVAAMTPEQWSEVIDTNLTGVFNACQVALPHLRRRGGGFIINISSLAGKNAFVKGAAYCASKAGLNAFSEALMQEVRYDNIRVSYVMPGSVATGFASGDETKGTDWKIAPDEVAEVVVNLLRHNPRSLPSRVELRPSKPSK